MAFVREAQSNGLLQSLPLSNLEQACMYLDPQSALPLSRVNKRLRTVFQDVQPWFATAYNSSLLPAEFCERFAVSKRNPDLLIEHWLTTQNEMRCLGISRDGKMALSSSYDKSVKLWDLKFGKCLRIFVGFKSYASYAQISPDGSKALLVDNKMIILWDLQRGEHLHTLKGHEGMVGCVLMNLDGDRALSGSYDTTLKLWDLTCGKCLHTLRGHESEVECLQIGADGKLALSGSSDGALKFWDLTKGECIRTVKGHESHIHCLEMNSDGQTALSASTDKRIKMWNLATGECIRTLEGHEEGITHLQIIPGEKKALSSSWDHTLKLWDLATGECLLTLKGHEDSVALFQISPDGKIVLSSSTDGVIKLWDLTTGQCLETIKLRGFSWANCLQITPDGVKAFMGGNCKEIVTILNLKPLPQERLSLVALAFRKLPIEGSMEKFAKLPSYVKRAIYQDLTQHYQTLDTEVPEGPEYGERIFHTLGPNKRAEILESHIAKTFLPDVAELFRAIERARMPVRQYISNTHPTIDRARPTASQRIPLETWSFIYDFLGRDAAVLSSVSKRLERSQHSIRCRTAAAYARFANLPERIRDTVYMALDLDVLKIKRDPRVVPPNYGELAFHNRDGAFSTYSEKASAIGKVRSIAQQFVPP